MFLQSFRKKQAISKNKKVFAQKFAIFLETSRVKNFFSQILWRVPRRNNIARDLRSTSQKIVLSSSRRQGIFEDLQSSRPRTSNCVLEAKDVLEDSTSDKNLQTHNLYIAL